MMKSLRMAKTTVNATTVLMLHHLHFFPVSNNLPWYKICYLSNKKMTDWSDQICYGLYWHNMASQSKKPTVIILKSKDGITQQSTKTNTKRIRWLRRSTIARENKHVKMTFSDKKNTSRWVNKDTIIPYCKKKILQRWHHMKISLLSVFCAIWYDPPTLPKS